MNKKPSVSVIAALLLVNACGSRVGAWEEPALDSAPMVVDVGDVPSFTDSVHTSPTTTSTVVSADGDIGQSEAIHPAPDHTSETTVAQSSTTTTTSSTTTTTSGSSTVQPSTTTQPPVDVDLDALNEALRELDELLGLFDSQVDSVDLDETEGETP